MKIRMLGFLVAALMLSLASTSSAITMSAYEGEIIETNHSHHQVGDYVFLALFDLEDDGHWDKLQMTAFSHVYNALYHRYSSNIVYDATTQIWTAFQDTRRMWEFSLLPNNEQLFYDYDPAQAGQTFKANVAPVPEPGTLILLGSGLLGLVGLRSWRNRKA